MKDYLKNPIVRVLAFALFGLISFYFGYFAFKPVTAVSYFSLIGYWAVAVCFALFLYFLYKLIRTEENLKAKFDRITLYWFAGVMAMSAIFLYRSDKPAFRMIMDDHVIAAVSKSLHVDRQATVPSRTIKINNTTHVPNHYVDKRPIFFHFLGATVSDLTGFHPKNTVYLNVALGLVLVALIFGFTRSFSSNLCAAAAVSLFISAPIVSNLANGGGLETCNMVMIMSTLWLGGVYLKRFDSYSFGAFTTSAILLAQTRYESVVFLLPVALTILYSWWQRRQVLLPGNAFFCPLFLIPYVWQHKVFELAEVMWQMEDVSRGDSPFGFEYLPDNLGRAIFYFFSIDPAMGNSFLLSALGIIALVALLVFSIKQLNEFKSLPQNLQALIFFLIGFASLFFLLLLYSWEFDQPLVRRLATPLFLPLSVLAAYLLFKVVAMRSFHIVAAVFIAAYFIGVSWPVTTKRYYLLTNNAYHQFRLAEEFLEEHKDDRIFIASDNSPFFSLYGVESIYYSRLNAYKPQVKFYLEQPGSADLLLFRRYEWDPVKDEYIPNDRAKIDEEFVTESVWEKVYSEVYKVEFLRVLDVKGVEPAGPEIPHENVIEYLQFWAENLP